MPTIPSKKHFHAPSFMIKERRCLNMYKRLRDKKARLQRRQKIDTSQEVFTLKELQRAAEDVNADAHGHDLKHSYRFSKGMAYLSKTDCKCAQYVFVSKQTSRCSRTSCMFAGSIRLPLAD